MVVNSNILVYILGRYFTRPNAEEYQELVIDNCDHIVHLTCKPKYPATYRSCSGYLTAALNTKHTMMITYHGENRPYKRWDAINVSTAKEMIITNADYFIDVYGNEWFFCKCKPERANVGLCKE